MVNTHQKVHCICSCRARGAPCSTGGVRRQGRGQSLLFQPTKGQLREPNKRLKGSGEAMGYAAENTNLTRLAIVVPTKLLLKVVETAWLNLEVVIEKVFTACLGEISEVPRGGTQEHTHFHLS